MRCGFSEMFLIFSKNFGSLLLRGCQLSFSFPLSGLTILWRVFLGSFPIQSCKFFLHTHMYVLRNGWAILLLLLWWKTFGCLLGMVGATTSGSVLLVFCSFSHLLLMSAIWMSYKVYFVICALVFANLLSGSEMFSVFEECWVDRFWWDLFFVLVSGLYPCLTCVHLQFSVSVSECCSFFWNIVLCDLRGWVF